MKLLWKAAMTALTDTIGTKRLRQFRHLNVEYLKISFLINNSNRKPKTLKDQEEGLERT
jgi:hypothetical protein